MPAKLKHTAYGRHKSAPPALDEKPIVADTTPAPAPDPEPVAVDPAPESPVAPETESSS